MKNQYLLGLDIGSSSIKVSLVDVKSGLRIAGAQSPDIEMPISSPAPGMAEQDPQVWWNHVLTALGRIQKQGYPLTDVQAIGISYQMHGLVMLDQKKQLLRPSIIWCDSRAVDIGEEAFEKLGREKALQSVLNSPGNFTASKLAWVRIHEPKVYERIFKIMLPGDYIAWCLTGDACTTISGLSEGILWDFKKNQISEDVLQALEIDPSVLPSLVPTMGIQGYVSNEASRISGLPAGIPVTYRAGDQPNNALSLNVFNPGEVAATAGTSGVIYGILDQLTPDPKSRVNLFAHVNHTSENPKLGVLLCINGTGILYSWLKNNLFIKNYEYPDMNAMAEKAAPGAGGIRIYPFGNGAERVLENKLPGGSIQNIDFNRHDTPHVVRAAQEGIIYALNYGFEIMQEMGVRTEVVRAGSANMFLSPLFASLFSTVTGTTVELYDTDGATGAARAAGIGAGIYQNRQEAFQSLKILGKTEPDQKLVAIYQDLYGQWKEGLRKINQSE